MLSSSESLGDLAAAGPEVRSVLLRHRLDFCCGGNRTLAAACENAGLPTDEVVAEIEAALVRQPDTKKWDQEPLPALIDHILKRFHQPLPGQLQGVIAAAEKVERVHGSKDTCPHGLAAHLHVLREELLSHMAKEEQILFPAILSGRRGAVLNGPVTVMMREHDEHGANLQRTRELAHDLVPPPEACRTWRALYEELARLEADLMAHVHLENHVLFPKALASEG